MWSIYNCFLYSDLWTRYIWAISDPAVSPAPVNLRNDTVSSALILRAICSKSFRCKLASTLKRFSPIFLNKPPPVHAGLRERVPPTAAARAPQRAPRAANGRLRARPLRLQRLRPLAPPQPGRLPAAPGGGRRRPFSFSLRLRAQVRACGGGGGRPPVSQAAVPFRGEGDACQRALGSAAPAGPPLPPRTFPFPVRGAGISAGRPAPPASHGAEGGGGAAPRPSSLFQSRRSTPVGPGGAASGRRCCPLYGGWEAAPSAARPSRRCPAVPHRRPGGCGRMRLFLLAATFCGLCLAPGKRFRAGTPKARPLCGARCPDAVPRRSEARSPAGSWDLRAARERQLRAERLVGDDVPQP